MLYKLVEKGLGFVSDTMNRIYYYNPITDTRQWKPQNLEYTVNLPENWKIRESSDGRVFFYDTETGTSQYNIPTTVDSSNFVKISKGEHGELKTDGKIVCKTDSCEPKYCTQKGYKIFNLMYILNNMGICPRPISVNFPEDNYEFEICMEHGGVDFGERFPLEEKKYLEMTLTNLGERLVETNLIFIDLCLQFNPGNIVYNKATKKATLIDFDLNWIRFGLDIPSNYWKDVLEVYKKYVFRGKDEDYDDDPFEIFASQLGDVNDKYLKYITLSQGLSSVNTDINQELFDNNDILFQGKLRKDLFQGTFKVKGYYDTRTPEMDRLL